MAIFRGGALGEMCLSTTSTHWPPFDVSAGPEANRLSFGWFLFVRQDDTPAMGPVPYPKLESGVAKTVFRGVEAQPANNVLFFLRAGVGAEAQTSVMSTPSVSTYVNSFPRAR